jgi:hypothetical protein
MKRLIWLVVLAAGCSSDPVDAEGMYTVAVTNRTNGCNFMNWTEDESAAGIQVVINQEGSDANADVMGATRVYLDLVLGTHVFNGTVDGDELDLKIEGTPSTTTGNCTWSVDAQLLANLDGDVLTGRINYTVAGNGHADCAPYDGCVSYQDMNGTRPPQ